MDEMASTFRSLYRRAASAVTEATADTGASRVPRQAQNLGDWVRSWRSDDDALPAESVRVLLQPGWVVKKYHDLPSRTSAGKLARASVQSSNDIGQISNLST
jgi:hypothetical protein